MVGHIKVLAVFHILWSALSLFTALVIGVFGVVGVGLLLVFGNESAAGIVIFTFLLLVVAFAYGLMALPGLIGGVALLLGRGWSRAPLIVAAALALASFPYGLALCGYTLVVLLDEDVRRELSAA